MQKKVIMWGAGKAGRDLIEKIGYHKNTMCLVAVIDNDTRKWDTEICGFKVISPDRISDFKFDKIIISSFLYFDQIKGQILNELGIEESYIDNADYLTKEMILNRYRDRPEDEIQEILNYLKNHTLDVFNYSFKEKYNLNNIRVVYDNYAGLYFVIHNGHKLYMARWLDTEDKVRCYYNSLCIEQDMASPHRYINTSFSVKKGDVVMDVGVAEGNFALDIIDLAAKVYLIESDGQWIEALNWTFKDYQEKVIIINHFVTDYSDGDTIKIDDIIEEAVNFIKLDVEGCEISVLEGARNTISRSPELNIVACTYHNDNDAEIIERILKEHNMECSFSRGYMFFPVSDQQKYFLPTLRRGVIRGEKKISWTAKN